MKVFRSRIFWRLVVAYTALVVLTGVAIDLLVRHEMRPRLELGLQHQAAGQAAALVPVAARALAGSQIELLRDTISQIAASTDTHITVIGSDGTVLANSDRDPAAVPALTSRPELTQAMQTGSGAARRFSDAAGGELLYFARRIDHESRVLGLVRVAVPLSGVDAELAAVRAQIVWAGSMLVVLALVLGVLSARRFAGPIADMTRVSEALRKGNYAARVRTKGLGEVGVLATNLNRLAEELQQRIARRFHQDAQLNAILRGMQEGVVALGPDGSIAFTNRSARTLLGLSPDADTSEVLEALGQVDGLAELLHRVRTTGSSLQSEVVVGRADQELVLDARATPLETGEPRGVLVVLYNLTHLRRLERIRTDFVANVSHELKTPLTSIQGYVETLLDGAVHDAEYNLRFLRKIDQHVRRLSALVSDLLSLARIEAPAESIDLGPVDWGEMIAESVARRQDPIHAKQLRLELDLGDAPLEVLGEREALQQIADNLLDNAINYTGPGGSIRVLGRLQESEGVLSITDTGIGIPAEALDRIFERFYRVDRGRSRSLGGTGLGLSIVRNLVQRMHGVVSVQSTVGQGSTFTVRIPRTRT